MLHFAWDDQRLLQGNISYIALLRGQYLDIALKPGQYVDIRAQTNLVEFEHSFERTNLRMQFKKFEFCNK